MVQKVRQEIIRRKTAHKLGGASSKITFGRRAGTSTKNDSQKSSEGSKTENRAIPKPYTPFSARVENALPRPQASFTVSTVPAYTPLLNHPAVLSPATPSKASNVMPPLPPSPPFLVSPLSGNYLLDIVVPSTSTVKSSAASRAGQVSMPPMLTKHVAHRKGTMYGRPSVYYSSLRNPKATQKVLKVFKPAGVTKTKPKEARLETLAKDIVRALNDPHSVPALSSGQGGCSSPKDVPWLNRGLESNRISRLVREASPLPDSGATRSSWSYILDDSSEDELSPKKNTVNSVGSRPLAGLHLVTREAIIIDSDGEPANLGPEREVIVIDCSD